MPGDSQKQDSVTAILGALDRAAGNGTSLVSVGTSQGQVHRRDQEGHRLAAGIYTDPEGFEDWMNWEC